MADVLLAEVTRGGSVESRHFGSAAIADASGVIWSAGDIGQKVFPRSAIKPIQALQLVESGAADASGLGPRELALACASHSGESFHVDLVRDWLERTGLSETDLGCGPQWPMSREAEHALVREGETPSRAHNNCSGKHAGFLNTARRMGEPIEGYVARDHPVQARWLDALAELAGEELDPALAGPDGCSIPSQPVSLSGLARAFGRLASRESLGAARRDAIERIDAGIAAHPELVAGTGRMCTRLMTATGGRLLAKTGAEGVYVAWSPERGLAMALKVADGATRASEVAIAALIARAFGPDDPFTAAAAPFTRQPLVTFMGEPAGEVRAAAL
jgi:L-asparaginase II